jgi:hypothetical protein
MADEHDFDENASIKLENAQVTLGDLAGLNLDDVSEKRFEALPKMIGIFEVEDAWLGVFGDGEKAKGGVGFKAKVLEVLSVNDLEFKGANDELVNKIHTQTFFITSVDSVGYIKAFFKDIGAPYDRDFRSMLAKSIGTRFQAPIGKRKDKNDTDVVYTQIVQNKVKPIAGAAVSEVAAKVA